MPAPHPSTTPPAPAGGVVAHDRPSGSNPRVRLAGVDVLADDWYVLRKVTFDWLGRDGRWQRQSREAYDRGNGATVLLHDPAAGTVLLTRQFRLPAFVNGHPDGMLLETPAGLLDADDAETAIRREAEEETGVRVRSVTRLLELSMSPGSVTERVAFFAAASSSADRVAAGGGVAGEEDIELVELPLAEALDAVRDGRIVDGKTVVLLQWACLHGLPAD